MEKLKIRTLGLFECVSHAPWADVFEKRFEDADDDDGVNLASTTPCARGRSLSMNAERAAAARVVLEPTIPMSEPRVLDAALRDGQSVPTEEPEVDDTRERGETTIVQSSLDIGWIDDGETATLEAIGVESASERASASERKRKASAARVEMTPLGVVRQDAFDVDVPNSACGEWNDVRGPTALRFSLGACAATQNETIATTSGRATKTDAITLTARVDDGAPRRVFLSDRPRCGPSSDTAYVGVVVESADGEDIDAVSFRVADDEVAFVGSCRLHARDYGNRRLSRRRSSASHDTSSASSSMSLDGVRWSPNGRFVFAPHATDGARVLAVEKATEGDDKRRSSASASKRQKSSPSTTPTRHLKCGFKVTRCATTLDEDGRFFLAVAGEPGRCVVFSWPPSESGDLDDVFVDDPDSTEEMPSANYRGVAPKPGAPTSLRWIGEPNDNRLVAVVDEALVYVWNTREKTRERSSYAIGHAIKDLVPVSMGPVDRASEAPFAALALASRKRASLETETESADDAGIVPFEVSAALVRAHGVSVGTSLFVSGASDARCVACASPLACLGTDSGVFIAWNVLTGVRLHVVDVKTLFTFRGEDDVAVRSVACDAKRLAFCAGAGVFILRRDV